MEPLETDCNQHQGSRELLSKSIFDYKSNCWRSQMSELQEVSAPFRAFCQNVIIIHQ